jgi:hypothetical protein
MVFLPQTSVAPAVGQYTLVATAAGYHTFAVSPIDLSMADISSYNILLMNTP